MIREIETTLTVGAAQCPVILEANDYGPGEEWVPLGFTIRTPDEAKPLLVIEQSHPLFAVLEQAIDRTSVEDSLRFVAEEEEAY